MSEQSYFELNSLEEIKKARPQGSKRLTKKIPADFQDRLAGALLARISGCLLGAIMEALPVQEMQDWADKTGDQFPPVDYWSKAPGVPGTLRYNMSTIEEYTRTEIKYVPVDDDIIYTLLGLLIMEDYGSDFTVEDVGKAWIKYLPYACTAEEIALNNLNAGVAASKVGELNNPYTELIGADIRSDPWAYVAPGWPEKAAELAWRDATISHRKNGIYSEMYFSAVQSAAFVVDDAMEALEIGLTEIPKDCELAYAVKWAMLERKNIHTYLEARKAVDEKFPGMAINHAINNTCLTIFGLSIGGKDVSKVISETVAMGLDNDCTAATAGSIIGAIVGKKGISKHWYQSFNNTIKSYLIDRKEFKIDDVLKRFTEQAEKLI
jgi:ADP-ribosylglycohydrolase